MEVNAYFWKEQKALYEAQCYDPKVKYESWQPARWAANRAAILNLKPYIKSVKSACEVGAGSAAFSFELARQCNLDITAIDKCDNAKDYALKIASDMDIPVQYHVEDLFDTKEKADLVLSLGVIEHFTPEDQIRFLEKCRDMTNRYVLVAIPNQESPIFINYVKWANRNSQEYEEKHQALTTTTLMDLFEEIGMSIVYADGFQVFLSELQFWNDMDLNTIPLYSEITKKALHLGDNWVDFPRINYEYSDIPVMVLLECGLSVPERLANGFMTYVLAEKV